MLPDQKIENYLRLSQPVIDSSFEPICVINLNNKIIYSNLPMRNILERSAKDLRENPNFCEVLQTEVCSPECQLETAMKTNTLLHLGDTPAKIGNRNLRIMLRVVPIHNLAASETNEAQGTEVIGAIVQLKDLTPQFELTAKYKLLLRSITDIISKGEEIKTIRSQINTKTS